MQESASRNLISNNQNGEKRKATTTKLLFSHAEVFPNKRICKEGCVRVEQKSTLAVDQDTPMMQEDNCAIACECANAPQKTITQDITTSNTQLYRPSCVYGYYSPSYYTPTSTMVARKILFLLFIFLLH